MLQTNVWDRVACLSVPGSTSDIAPGGIFPPQDNQVNNVKDCLDMGLNPSFANQTNDEIIKHYRFTAPDLIKTKRLLFTQGGYDPTTAVGPPVFPVSNDREATRTVLMHGLAHAEEVMGQSFPGADSVPLQMVIQTIFERG